MTRILNWIIETFYPDRLFYGPKANPFQIMEEAADETEKQGWMLAAIVLADMAEKVGADRAIFEVRVAGKSGEAGKLWQITAKEKDE